MRSPAGLSLRDALRRGAALPSLTVDGWKEWWRHQGRQLEALVAGSTRLVRAVLDGELRELTTGRPPMAPATTDEGRPAVEPERPAPVDDPAPDVGPAPDAEDLPIESYESLAASHVVDRLAHLTAEELRVVRSFEEANRGRRRVLSQIDALLAGA